MAIVDRYLSRSFRASEFRCRCRRPECDAVPMDMMFIIKLQKLRDLIGKPVRILSGSRCPYWNKKVGGAKASMHLLGKAADIGVDDFDLSAVIAPAIEAGMGGIGVASTFIHVDDGPAGRRWTY